MSVTIPPMIRGAKIGFGAAGAGLVIGLSVIGWMYSHRPDDTVATKPGSIGFDLSQAPSPSPGASASTPAPADKLTVSNSAGGTVLGTDQQGTSTATRTPAPSLPGPNEFGQYDQYKSNAASLYIDVVVGTGKAIAAGSKATVNYCGYLTNGTKFDETSTDKPFTFTETSGSTIIGWLEGVYGMKEGGQRRIIVPPGQGYGDKAYGPIPAGSVLVFDVTLLSVQ